MDGKNKKTNGVTRIWKEGINLEHYLNFFIKYVNLMLINLEHYLKLFYKICKLNA